MLSSRKIVTILGFLVIVSQCALTLPTLDKDRFANNVEITDEDSGIDNALINYLFTKQIVNRLRNQLDAGDLARKRSYWKQCAFNAVSCFGK